MGPPECHPSLSQHVPASPGAVIPGAALPLMKPLSTSSWPARRYLSLPNRKGGRPEGSLCLFGWPACQLRDIHTPMLHSLARTA
jgi:hypothetical protein